MCALSTVERAMSWLPSASFSVLCSLVAPSLASSSVLPSASYQGADLELTEASAHVLPAQSVVAGASLSPDGTRVLVWFLGRQDLFLLEENEAPRAVEVAATSAEGSAQIVGGAFLDGGAVEVVQSNGVLSLLRWNSSHTHSQVVLAVEEIHAAVRGLHGWWLLAGSGGSNALYHLRDGEIALEEPIIAVEGPYDRFFLSATDTDLLMGLREPPHFVWKIDDGGATKSILKPTPPENAERPDSIPPPRWVALNALPVGSGVLQVVADVTSDARLLVVYNSRGEERSSRVLEAPIGLLAAASDAPAIALLRTFERSEVVLYHWRWRGAPDR